MRKTDPILCLCAGGKVRSVAAKYLLEDAFGCMSVLTAGLKKTDLATLGMLLAWADVILVVGEAELLELVPDSCRPKTHHLDVGPDHYGTFHHGRLLRTLEPMIKELLQ